MEILVFIGGEAGHLSFPIPLGLQFTSRLWDGAACCFQIARIFIYFAALYKWNIQCAATSDVCHDYSAALCVVCQLHFVVTFTYMSILLTFCSIVMEYQFDYSTSFCLVCYFIIVQDVFVRFSPFRHVDLTGKFGNCTGEI